MCYAVVAWYVCTVEYSLSTTASIDFHMLLLLHRRKKKTKKTDKAEQARQRQGTKMAVAGCPIHISPIPPTLNVLASLDWCMYCHFRLFWASVMGWRWGRLQG